MATAPCTKPAKTEQKRLFRKETRKLRSQQTADRLAQLVGFDKRADRVRQCSTWLKRKSCSDCGHDSYLGLSTCKDRACDTCQHIRSQRLILKYAEPIEKYIQENNLHAYMLTLTFKNSDSLPDYRKLNSYRKRLLARKLFQDYGLRGGLCAFEVTENKNTGQVHPHFHCLILTERPLPIIATGKKKGAWQVSFNQAVAEEWKRITGNSYIVDGREFVGMNELIKYATKSVSDLSDSRFVEFVLWSKGKRFLSAFGDLYGNKKLFSDREEEVEEHEYKQCGCTECGSTNVERHLLHWRPEHGRYVFAKRNIEQYEAEEEEESRAGP